MAQTQGPVEKHPWAAMHLTVDWAAYVAVAPTTLIESQWVDADGAGVTFTGAAISGAEASVLVEGGTNGRTAYIENRATFADGTREVTTIVMLIASKVPAA